MRVIIDNKEFDVREDITMEEFIAENPDTFGKGILGISIDGYVTRLSSRLYENANIQTIHEGTEDGYRIYRQSLLFVLISAVNRVFPSRTLYIRQSVNKSTYCELSGNLPDESEIEKLSETVRKMVEEKFPINVKKVTKSEAKKLLGEKDLEKLIFTPREEIYLYEDNGQYYGVYGATVPHAGYLKDFEIVSFEAGFLLRYPHPDTGKKISPFRTDLKIIETVEEYRTWNEVIGITDVFQLNKAIKEGNINECINLSEIMHEKKISHIADEIKNDILNKKVVLISGPSSSGKTTFANRLMLHLRVNGINPVIISLDDYFYGRDNTPIDEFGNPNFEDIDALEYKLFNKHLNELIKGNEVTIPRFDFNVGERAKDGRKIRLESNSVIIVEGIHALNEKLTYGVHHKNKYKIYCSALTVMCFDKYNPISPTDTRLIRRMVRDFRDRNSSALETLDMWDSVQRGEVKNIFPFEESADVIFNSATAYEFAVYKNLAVPLLEEVLRERKNLPRAQRLLELLSYFEPITDESIPPTSIIREFIGNNTLY